MSHDRVYCCINAVAAECNRFKHYKGINTQGTCNRTQISTGNVLKSSRYIWFGIRSYSDISVSWTWRGDGLSRCFTVFLNDSDRDETVDCHLSANKIVGNP